MEPNLRAEETTIKVARVRRFGFGWSAKAWSPLVQASLLSSVFATRERMESDFPMPMSSARIPPPLSSFSELDTAPVTACRNLGRKSQQCVHLKTRAILGSTARFNPPPEAKVIRDWSAFSLHHEIQCLFLVALTISSIFSFTMETCGRSVVFTLLSFSTCRRLSSRRRFA